MYAICDLATYPQYQIAVYTVGSSQARLDFKMKKSADRKLNGF